MAKLLYCLTSLLFVDIPLLYYINLKLSMICCLFSESVYLFFSISILLSTVADLFCGEVSENFVILSAILPSIKSPVTSSVF